MGSWCIGMDSADEWPLVVHAKPATLGGARPSPPGIAERAERLENNEEVDNDDVESRLSFVPLDVPVVPPVVHHPPVVVPRESTEFLRSFRLNFAILASTAELLRFGAGPSTSIPLTPGPANGPSMSSTPGSPRSNDIFLFPK